MIRFRPLAGITIATAILLALLIGLGAWQLQRLQWKLGLIAQVDRNMHGPALSLDAALRLGGEAEYHRVTLDGRYLNAKEAYIYGIDAQGTPVYHVVVPFRTADGRVLLVDRGIVPGTLRDPRTRPASLIGGAARFTGIWRRPEGPGAFTPAPDLAARVWYARDIASIARHLDVAPAAPVLLEADAAPNPGGWPKGGQTVVTFRNEHLQYAITWFLMAAGLLGVYLAYHVSRGRLTLTKHAQS